MAPVAPPVLTSPQRPTGEEYRALLQRRLGAFFAWPSAVFVFFLVSHLATSGVVGPRVGLSLASMRVAYFVGAAVAVLCAGIFVACRRSPLPERTLRVLDVSGFLALGARMVFVSLAYFRISVSVGGVFLILSRAGVVPSTGRRTAIASFGCAIVLAIGGLAIPATELHGPLSSAYISFGLYAVAAALATFTSHNIYGLRLRFEEARRFGQYVLGDAIGQGGTGRVYRARHAFLCRDTALRDCTEGPGWSQAGARAWWAEHGGRLRSRRDQRRAERAEGKPTPFETGTHVAIDVHGRVGATPVEGPRRPAA